MTERVDVIVSGHLCLDLIPNMEHVALDALTKPGQLYEVGELSISTGGAVSNTGLALQRLGIAVRLMASVGDDLTGRLIIAALRDRDPLLAELITLQEGRSSSYSVILSPQKTDRVILHNAGANRVFGADSVDVELLSQARIFHLGYPPILPRLIVHEGKELTELYRRVKETGVVSSMDMSLPDPQGASGRVNWAQILQNALPYVDIFIPSIEEILLMLRRSDYEQWYGDVLSHLDHAYLERLAAELIDMGVVIAGFKLGEMGFYIQCADAEHFERLERLPINVANWAGRSEWSPAYKVDVVGTTGAGDSAYAGFLAALVHGVDASDAVRWACAVGACNVEAADATSGVREWEATRERMEAGWPQHGVRLPGIG